MFKLHPQLAQDSVFVCDLKLCRVLLANDSQYPWLILVPMRNGIREIIDLSEDDQLMLWQESAQISRVLKSIYQPDKLNIAALGNIVPQLHLHHVARFATDVAWPAPIWGKYPSQPYNPESIAQITAVIIQSL